MRRPLESKRSIGPISSGGLDLPEPGSLRSVAPIWDTLLGALVTLFLAR